MKLLTAESFCFPPLTGSRTRGSAPQTLFVLLFSQMPQILHWIFCAQGLFIAPSKTHQPCLLSGRAQNCFCLISLVGFYVASGPLVPIKVSPNIKCPVLVLHSTCLQLNHAVGFPSLCPDCVLWDLTITEPFSRYGGLYWGPGLLRLCVMRHQVELRTQPTQEFCLKLSIQEIDFGGRSNSSS